MRLTRITAAVTLLAASFTAFAATPDEAIRKTLDALQVPVPIESISESPLAGVYQVQLEGGRQLYASADGQFLMQGYLMQLKDGKLVNLTEQAESKAIAAQINAFPKDKMVIFSPESPKTHITVFTDTECGYCRKLHSEVPELNRLGVEVRYLAFPRQGLNGPVAKELASVWCASDKQDAMNRAKAGKKLAEANASCKDPVAEEYELGMRLGVNGTPAVILANGMMIPGYQPAPQLAKLALEAAKQ